jgi:hypothetical protein
MALSGSRLLFITNYSAITPLGYDTLVAWDLLMSRMYAGLETRRPTFFPSKLWLFRTIAIERATSSTLGSVGRIQGRRLNSKPLNWKMTELQAFCEFSLSLLASNPKDKLYALLNIMDLDIEINYSDSTSVKALYTQFARLYLGAEQGSELLACSGVGKGVANEFQLPSWVPDWHMLSMQEGGSGANPYQLNLWESCYNSHRNLDCPRWTTSNDLLLAHGCLIERIVSSGLVVSREPHWLSELFEFCVDFTVRRKNKHLSLPIVPSLQVLFTTLLRDLPPNVLGRWAPSNDRLYGKAHAPGQATDLVLLFLNCIVDIDTGKTDRTERRDKVCERLSLLGYDLPAKLFDDFLQSQFSPRVKYVTSSQPPERVVGFPSTISLETFSNLLISPVVNPVEAKFQMLQVFLSKA